MTEAEWRSSDDWRAMLTRLAEQLIPTRKWTLYLCGGLRQIWDHWLYSDHSRNAVEVAERAADGAATEEEIRNAEYMAEIPVFGCDFDLRFILAEDPGRRFSADFCRLIEWGIIREDEIGLGDTPKQRLRRLRDRHFEIDDDDRQEIEGLLYKGRLATRRIRRQLSNAASIVEWAIGLQLHPEPPGTTEPSESLRRTLAAQPDWPGGWLLREVFGNPLAPVALEPAWRTEAAVGLATGIYDDKAFERLPILADALEEAGCDHPDILTHCREPGTHIRGCWVVDLVLGKV